MNAVEIEQAISDLALQSFDAAEFPFSFLAAFGNKDITLKRLCAGNNNSDMPIPRHVGLAAYDIEMLAGLPEGYFRGTSNVVQLARLRPVPSAPMDAESPERSTVVPFRSVPKR